MENFIEGKAPFEEILIMFYAKLLIHKNDFC